MKVCLLRSPAAVDTNPLDYTDVPDLQPSQRPGPRSSERLWSMSHRSTCGRRRATTPKIARRSGPSSHCWKVWRLKCAIPTLVRHLAQ